MPIKTVHLFWGKWGNPGCELVKQAKTIQSLSVLPVPPPINRSTDVLFLVAGWWFRNFVLKHFSCSDILVHTGDTKWIFFFLYEGKFQPKLHIFLDYLLEDSFGSVYVFVKNLCRESTFFSIRDIFIFQFEQRALLTDLLGGKVLLHKCIALKSRLKGQMNGLPGMG